jgi:putative ABC transport system permease protein
MRSILHNFLFVLKRFKTSSILSIVGLSVAFAVFFAIVARVYYDFSFDRNFEKGDNIYMYSQKTNTRIPEEHAAKYPEIKNICFTQPEMWMTETFDINDDKGNVREFQEKAIHVSEGFIDMFIPEKAIRGNVSQIFNIENHAMLTESVAKKIFGDDDPLGKIISYHLLDRIIPVTVAAICEDFPDNCSFENGIYFKQPQKADTEVGYTVYVEINPEARDILTEKLNREKESEMLPYELIALRDVHFKFPEQGKERKLGITLSLLLAMGILILIIAYINFINFSMSMSPVRLKGFNIKRILGESPFFQKFSIAMESVLISFVAFMISLFIIQYFNISVIREFLKIDLSLSENIYPLLLTAGTSLVAGFIAGIYPAFYATHFKPAMALKGSFSVSSGGNTLRNILISIQFSTAICLIIIALFIKIQHDYIRYKSLGMNTENIICIPPAGGWDVREVFEAELRKSPDIIDIAFTTSLPGDNVMHYWERQFEGKTVGYTMWGVSPSILKVLDIDIIKGRGFEEKDFPGKDIVILNRAFINEYGFDNIVGKYLPGGWGDVEIVGIMEDFNFKSLKKEPVSPIAFFVGDYYSKSFGWYLLVKIDGKKRHQAISYINETWKQFSTEIPDIYFLNEKIDKLYEDENNLAKLISICGLITVIVAIMGVYGLILFNVKSKRKTIALHKINGASVREVILMLNRGFIVQFAAAYIVAVPVAYIFVSRWIENFAYKTAIHWWVFVLGGLLVFLITALTVSRQSYKAATENPIEGIKME